MAAPPAPPLLRTYTLEDLSAAEVKALMARPRVDFGAIVETVRTVRRSAAAQLPHAARAGATHCGRRALARRRGGERVHGALRRSDVAYSGRARVGARPPAPARARSRSAAPQELPEPVLAPAVRAAFDLAFDNIARFHAAQRTPDVDVETMPGVRCRRVSRPIGAVGLYVPGGTAVLPSTALMLAVPAQIAGCRTGARATRRRAAPPLSPRRQWCWPRRRAPTAPRARRLSTWPRRRA
jgi:histidinol dehydrogenase